MVDNMSLTQEQFDQLPDFVKTDYTQDGDVFVHVGVKKLKGTLDGLDAKNKEYETRLKTIESESAKKQADAEQAALEKLKADGKFDEIMKDAERRIGETTKQYEERIAKMQNAIKTEKRNSVVSDLASELATEAGSKAFKMLIASRIDVDPETGKITFLNDDGSASSLDFAGFKSEIQKDKTYTALLKATVSTNGGGLLNGNSGGSANASTTNTLAQEAKKKGDLTGFLKSHLSKG
jgi:predicted component of type VI protein secretion system